MQSGHYRCAQDQGLFDGIQRVIFGNGFDFWIHRLIMLDAISFLSHGKLSLPLQRYILIDIDDIFVGEKGTRMKPADVETLLAAQKRFRQLVPGFRFNLGFSGKYYHHGSVDIANWCYRYNMRVCVEKNFLTENADKFYRRLHSQHVRGERRRRSINRCVRQRAARPEPLSIHQLFFLVQTANSREFWWFCHMWSHSQPHLYNMTMLEQEMKLNKEFAQVIIGSIID